MRFLWLTPFASFILGYLFIALIQTKPVLKTPALVGQTIDKALIELSSKNLNVRIIGHKDDPQLPEGTILSQTPAADTPIKENQAIYVMIAQKPAPLQMPNLAHMHADEAVKLLENLSAHPHSSALANDAPQNSVIAQSPQAGNTTADTPIIIYTAQPAAKPVIMPNLKSKLIDEVVSFLNLHGINPKILHTTQTDFGHQCHNCIVIDQRPLAGSLITLSPDKPIQVQLQVA